jgi:hypothetical protein
MSEYVCDQCGFEAKTRMGLVGHKNRKDHQPGYVDVSRETSGDDVSRETSEPVEPAEEVAPVLVSDETAPRKPGLVERIRSRRGRGRDGGRTAPTSAERPPKRKRPTGRRVSLDADISDIWAFGGRRLEATPHYPTGRMLQYQAPAAGVIIDRAVAGTLPDRVLFQPLARNRDRYEDVGFLLAAPLLTASITMTMQRMQAAIDASDKDAFDQLATKLQMQREMLTWLLTMLLPRLAAGAKLAAEKKAKRDAAIADAFPDLGDKNPAEVLADMLFTPFGEEVHTNGRVDPTTAQPAEEGSVPFGI